MFYQFLFLLLSSGSKWLFVWYYFYLLLFSLTKPTDGSSKDRWKSIQENVEVVTGILIGNFLCGAFKASNNYIVHPYPSNDVLNPSLSFFHEEISSDWGKIEGITRDTSWGKIEDITRDTSYSETCIKVLLNVSGVHCFPGCNAECLGKLTTGSGEKTLFNGQALGPLVLLVEVSNKYQAVTLNSINK